MDLTILMILFISSFEIINVAIPDPNSFSWIALLVANAAAVYSSVIKALLAVSSTFSKPVFTNGCKVLPENPPDSPFLCNWVFEDSILADEIFTKALRNL